MTEYIGARISLISKSDIRYVGILHEINSENSTVALEQVSSFGTEGRRANPDDEIPPSDSIYDYIVFRGTDVKDLRIEETPAPKENKPQVPDDPAILGSGTRPTPQQQPSHNQRQQGPPGAQQQGPQAGPPFPQHPQYPPYYPPPPTGWGRGGPPGPGGFPPMPYGAPPGWYPPGQGFPPGPFPPPYGYPPGPPGQFQRPGQNGGPPGQFQQPLQDQQQKPAPIGPGAAKQTTPPATQNEKSTEPKGAAKSAAETAASSVPKGPTPPVATKPSPTEIKAAENQASVPQAAPSAASKSAPSGPKNNRVAPAIPLQSPAIPKTLQSHAGNVAPTQTSKQAEQASSLSDATKAATAAVAAAMAKLPAPGQQNGNAVDNLTRKVSELRTNDTIRAPRQPGGAAGFTTTRGGRGGRGGARNNSAQKVEVPDTDFDFQTANAKFNKQDLVKEAIAGSPVGEVPPVASPTEPEVPVGGYNKSTSFFDNISSESKDRMEAGNTRPGGREWRGEEQKKNVETFGQGSVDNGYRGGYRGRGRGRGGYRGRGGHGGNGQPARGRGGYRGRGDATIV